MELCKYDVISFDVFDTLIFRNVHNPADIFFQLEQELHMPGFAKKRIHAEQRARAEKYRDKNTREVVIEEIYSSMDIDSIAGFDTQEIMSREIDQELQCCYANPIMKKIVRILAGNHKTMIAVSDMYLHRNQIKQILQKSGYDEMKKIYSSGDFGVSKSDGRLFPIILSEWNASRLIHIGDNFFSDVYQQKHLNMKTLHYLC